MLNEHIGHLDAQQVFNMIYPVGSIYMSVNSTSPSILFGGTWEQIEDTFLLTAGSTYTAGDTGGSATHTPDGILSGGAVGNHTLTETELPVVRSGTIDWHGQEHGTHIYTIGDKWYGTKVNNMYQTTGQTNGAYSYQSIGFQFGGGGAHNHPFTQPTFTGTSQNTMPPYLAVYCWKRTA